MTNDALRLVGAGVDAARGGVLGAAASAAAYGGTAAYNTLFRGTDYGKMAKELGYNLDARGLRGFKAVVLEAMKAGIDPQFAVSMVAYESGGTFHTDTNGAPPFGVLQGTAADLGYNWNELKANPELAAQASVKYHVRSKEILGTDDPQKLQIAYYFGADSVQEAENAAGDQWLAYIDTVVAPRYPQNGVVVTGTEYLGRVGFGGTSAPQGRAGAPTAETPDPTSSFTYDQNGFPVLKYEDFLAQSGGDPASAVLAFSDYMAARREYDSGDINDAMAYLEAVSTQLAADIQSRRLTLDEANSEFDRRITAFREGQSALRNVIPYTIPKDAAGNLFGFGEGGIGNTLGMAPPTPSYQAADPYQAAIDLTRSGSGGGGSLDLSGTNDAMVAVEDALGMARQWPPPGGAYPGSIGPSSSGRVYPGGVG